MGPVVPPRSLRSGIGRKKIGFSRLMFWFAFALSVLAGSASSHDASSYGGVFRSRDLGASWLNADVGLFINAALIIAVDPRDSSHLLAGTDLGILSSHNGGPELDAGGARSHHRRGIRARFLTGRRTHPVRVGQRRVSSRPRRLAACGSPSVGDPGAGAGRRHCERSFLSASAETNCSQATTAAAVYGCARIVADSRDDGAGRDPGIV